jgi:PAS domain S-box-containing protein
MRWSLGSFNDRKARYAIAFLTITMSTALALALQQASVRLNPAVFFLWAVMTSAWLGYGPGILSILLAVVAVPWLIVPSFSIQALDLTRVGVLAMVALLISWVRTSRDRGESRLRATAADLERQVAERTGELIQANEALRHANQQLRVLIDAAPMAIWATDLEGKVTFWNPTATALFGWKEGEVLQKCLPTIPAEQQDEFRHWLARYARGETLSGVERLRQRKDGSLIEVSIWTAPVRNPAGVITGNIGMVVDVSERKRLEAQFRQAQKMDALGRLAGGVAHDFNNLLTAISGFTAMLLEELREDSLRDYAHEVQHAAEQAASLTHQLLAFSRHHAAQPQLLDLNVVVANSVKLLRRLIGEQIRLLTHLDAGLWRVRADPAHLEQVIINLAINARDAMPRGGTLTIETRNVSLDTEYAGRHIGVAAGPYVQLSVSDTGTGMTPEIRERLFEPFYTTKPAGLGTGLGLSIVFGVVKQSQGEIIVYSEPGQGTSFKIYLPQAEGAPEETFTVKPATPAHGNETILLVEDDDTVRKIVLAMLEQEGYTVLVADSPGQAERLSSTHTGTIHLLLTDIIMPERSGPELYALLSPQRTDLKVLYISGYTETSVIQGALIEQPDRFLQKPFTGRVLLAKMREVLSA